MALDEQTILSQFERGYSFPPLEISLGRKATRNISAGDAILYVSWGNDSYDFIAEFKARSTPRIVADAMRAIKDVAEGSPSWPMIVVPYLREEQLEELRRNEVSGIDLSGNGIISVPGKFFVYRTGKPNKFPDSQPSKYAYRGSTSLVARAFLCRTTFESLADIEKEIQSRGGKIALSTISKALKRLEEDIIIERKGNDIRLVQPDKLLEKLTESYRPPKVRNTVTCSTKQPLAKLFEHTSRELELALSGRSSIEAYAVMGRDEYPVIYTNNIAGLLDQWKDSVEETSRFVDFELQETSSPTVYFDVRPKDNLPYASPVQVYLECSRGDKREKETAEQVRTLIIREQK